MVFEKIAALLADNLGIDQSEIKLNSTFQDLGLDSLDTVDLLMSLEEEFGVTIEVSEDLQRVEDVVKVIEEQREEK